MNCIGITAQRKRLQEDKKLVQNLKEVNLPNLQNICICLIITYTDNTALLQLQV